MSAGDTHRARARSTDYIGAPLPRANALRLLAGRGQYVDDLQLPRLAHAAMVRSPYAHARIVTISADAARAAPGVLRVLTGADVARLCRPYVGVLLHVKGMRSAPQLPLAIDRARWQGEPVVAVVADSRAQAEDAAQLVAIEWGELPPVTNAETALDPQTPLIHPELGSNLCFERTVDTGDVDAVFARADHVVEETFVTARHAATPLETRGIVADFNPAERHLTVWQST